MVQFDVLLDCIFHCCCDCHWGIAIPRPGWHTACSVLCQGGVYFTGIRMAGPHPEVATSIQLFHNSAFTLFGVLLESILLSLEEDTWSCWNLIDMCSGRHRWSVYIYMWAHPFTASREGKAPLPCSHSFLQERIVRVHAAEQECTHTCACMLICTIMSWKRKIQGIVLCTRNCTDFGIIKAMTS